MPDFADILDQEKKVAELIAETRNALFRELSEAKNDSVHHLGKNMITIKLSQLQHNIWTPEYYIPEVQAAYVESALLGVTTAHAFVKKLAEMVENRYIKIGQNKHPLNDQTISILKKYLGGE